MNDTPAEFVRAYSEHVGHIVKYRDINQGSAIYTGTLVRVQWNKDRGITELWIDDHPSKVVSFDKFRGCSTCEAKAQRL